MCVGSSRSYVRPYGPKMTDFGTPKITFLQLYDDFGESKSGHFPMSASDVRKICPHPASLFGATLPCGCNLVNFVSQNRSLFDSDSPCDTCIRSVFPTEYEWQKLLVWVKCEGRGPGPREQPDPYTSARFDSILMNLFQSLERKNTHKKNGCRLGCH